MPYIYLDNNATTAIDPQVLSVMEEELRAPPSNPSSVHTLGQRAKKVLLEAREKIAHYCKAKTGEIIFTSGGTESMNLLLQGMATPGCHIISSNTEHACIENQLLSLEKKGHTVTRIPSRLQGAPLVEEVAAALTPRPTLLIFSAVNAETGVLLDIEAFSALAQQKGVPLLLDGVALLGKEPLHIPEGVTGMGFSAHKCHGPKGAGFIFLQSKAKLSPLLLGGGQERGLRSGTPNLPGIVGMAEAVHLLETQLLPARNKMEELRTLLEQELLYTHHIPYNGTGKRVCNVSNLLFPTHDAETLLIQLDQLGIGASHGSACSSGAIEPSRVLQAMGLSFSQARSSIRFSLSRFTTKEEILQTIQVLRNLL